MVLDALLGIISASGSSERTGAAAWRRPKARQRRGITSACNKRGEMLDHTIAPARTPRYR
jgi:hypothetical protein